MVYKIVEVEVDIDLEEFDDDELIDELESRGINYYNPTDVIERIWQNRRQGKDYQRELDDLIYEVLGRI